VTNVVYRISPNLEPASTHTWSKTWISAEDGFDTCGGGRGSGSGEP